MDNTIYITTVKFGNNLKTNSDYFTDKRDSIESEKYKNAQAIHVKKELINRLKSKLESITDSSSIEQLKAKIDTKTEELELFQNEAISLYDESLKSLEKEENELYLINKPKDVDIFDVDINKNKSSEKLTEEDHKELLTNYQVDMLYVSLTEKDHDEGLRLLSFVEMLYERATLLFDYYFNFKLKSNSKNPTNFFKKNKIVKENRDKEYLILKLVRINKN